MHCTWRREWIVITLFMTLVGYRMEGVAKCRERRSLCLDIVNISERWPYICPRGIQHSINDARQIELV